MANAPDLQVPRLVFVNKLDRVGANPFRVIQQARDKLRLNAAAVQVRGRVAGAGGWGRVCVCGGGGGKRGHALWSAQTRLEPGEPLRPAAADR